MDTAVEKREERSFGLSSFALHCIAMALMLGDHMWGTNLLQYDILTAVGRIAFPLFSFMIVEGFFHTSSRKKYALRLAVFALISEIPFNLMMGGSIFNPLDQNVLFTFLLAVALMCIYEKIRLKKRLIVRLPLYILITLAFYIIGMFTFVDYYGYGILITAMFYFTRISKDEPTWKKLLCKAAQLVVLFYICNEMIKGLAITVELFGYELELCQQSLAVLALPLIWLYNGRQGPYNKFIKYFYYFFYPAHILVLSMLSMLL